MSYTPRGWRKLFPYYWELGRKLECMDREAEKQPHRNVDFVFENLKREHVAQANKYGLLDKIPEIVTVMDFGKEQVHKMLEDRGIRR